MRIFLPYGLEKVTQDWKVLGPEGSLKKPKKKIQEQGT